MLAVASKTFVLGHERLPSVAYLLAESGEPMPGVAVLQKAVDGWASDTFPVFGATWSDVMSVTPWTAEQLVVDLPVPDLPGGASPSEEVDPA